MMLIHSKNILHRDFKLQNMFLSKANILKLGDFGVAKELQENLDFATTICGTPYYMAPEVTQGQRYGPKADIFALGIALYEMTTFELPFADESIPGLFDQILHKTPAPIGGDYDDEIKDIIFTMLAKDPESRPSTFELFQTDFIHERITDWCLNDPKIKAYMESMINVRGSNQKSKGFSQKGSKKSSKKLVTKENPNFYCENPNILVSEVMKDLTIKNETSGSFGSVKAIFTGHDLYDSVKQIKGFSKANTKVVDQLCNF